MSGGGRVGSKCVRCDGLFITPQSRGKLCEECIDAEEREDRRGMAVWHVYGCVVPEGEELAGCWQTVSLALSRPQEMTYTLYGMPYLASFDHEPSEEEMEALRND